MKPIIRFGSADPFSPYLQGAPVEIAQTIQASPEIAMKVVTDNLEQQAAQLYLSNYMSALKKLGQIYRNLVGDARIQFEQAVSQKLDVGRLLLALASRGNW